MASLVLVKVAKVMGLTSSGLFAGYTIALSDSNIPSILHAKDKTNEALLLAMWREQYLKGFYVAVPFTITNVASWGYLAYLGEIHSMHKRPDGNNPYTPDSMSPEADRFHPAPTTKLRNLYITTLLATGTATVFAWTLLRSTNGALSLRASKIAGPGPDPNASAITYAIDEPASKEVERTTSTIDLVKRWGRLNAARGYLLAFGTLLGACIVAAPPL